MKPATKPKARKRPRPVCPEALRYEAFKADISRQRLSPTEYAQACRRAARKAGL